MTPQEFLRGFSSVQAFFGEKLNGAESTGVVMALLAVVLLGRLAA